jgi:signal transduction histidine kinase
MMSPYAVQKGFEIRTQLNADGQAPFDSDAVTQIVVNLLDNALKYSGKSEDKTIILRTQNTRQYVCIEVEDHGPGIAFWHRKKVFQQFYRIGNEDTRETAGSGLGLALVQNLAQAHKGFVEIHSVRPHGAIFKVSLSLDAG